MIGNLRRTGVRAMSMTALALWCGCAGREGTVGVRASVEGGGAAVRTREQVEERHKWDLRDLYADEAAWKADYAKAEGMVRQAREMKGTASGSAAGLLAALKHRDESYVRVDRLAVYASLRQDEDLANTEAQARYGRAMDLYNRFSEAWSWLQPEILQIPDESLDSWLGSDGELAVYRHALDDIRRMRPHTLSPREEELLAMAGDVTDAMGRTFSLMTNADLKFPKIRDEQGAEVELSPARFSAFLNSRDARVRREAFIGLHKTYESYENTIGSLLAFQVKRAIFYARARHFDSALEAALKPDNVPVSVYENLVSAVNEALPLLHQFAALRKRVLKLGELHPYDLYVPLVTESPKTIPYDEAVETIVSALGILGPEYAGPLREGFGSRWIDVYETKGKRSGAYCSGTYTSHPYLLLNYEGTSHDRSTVAHEMGHAMHTWFTTKHQPIVYGDYSIFCAEVASTVNEVILNDYLMKRAETDAERLELVNSLLENIRLTVFRQTLFAEFEKQTHALAEAGTPLTPDLLQKTYRDLVQKYYGPELVIDPETDSECLRIPHFYRNFYVYKYATSYAAATDIGRRILAGEPGAREGLMAFLKAGSSVYPIDCLKLAGVDMTTPTPVRNCMKLFGEKLAELERLLGS